jgi:hypothetical protein
MLKIGLIEQKRVRILLSLGLKGKELENYYENHVVVSYVLMRTSEEWFCVSPSNFKGKIYLWVITQSFIFIFHNICLF